MRLIFTGTNDKNFQNYLIVNYLKKLRLAGRGDSNTDWRRSSYHLVSAGTPWVLLMMRWLKIIRPEFYTFDIPFLMQAKSLILSPTAQNWITNFASIIFNFILIKPFEDMQKKGNDMPIHCAHTHWFCF